MNEYGWIIATDTKVRLVVPHSVDRRSVAIEYADVTDTEARTLLPKELIIRTTGRNYTANLVDEDDPVPVAEFVRSPPNLDDPAETDAVETSLPFELSGGAGGADGTSATADGTGPGSEAAETSAGRAAGRPEEQTDGEGTGSPDDPIAKLDRLATLRDRGVVSEDEFEAKKQDLLDEL
jgi:hypothetical protein